MGQGRPRGIGPLTLVKAKKLSSELHTCVCGGGAPSRILRGQILDFLFIITLKVI